MGSDLSTGKKVSDFEKRYKLSTTTKDNVLGTIKVYQGGKRGKKRPKTPKKVTVYTKELFFNDQSDFLKYKERINTRKCLPPQNVVTVKDYYGKPFNKLINIENVSSTMCGFSASILAIFEKPKINFEEKFLEFKDDDSIHKAVRL